MQLPFEENPAWKEILERLSQIRESEDFSGENVEFIRQQLQSPDDRIRAAAALAAEGCLFEPYILNLLLNLLQEDENISIRKAAAQSLQGVIHAGVMEGLENELGAGTEMDYVEEWEEVQSESLRENYLRVKETLLNILQDEFEDVELREMALMSLSDLGMHRSIRQWIREFLESPRKSSRLVAIHAMGKYPQYWESHLARMISPQTDKALLLEAISAAYSSDSEKLARRIEQVLQMDDPDILSYALLTLANINRTENLGEILQRFSLHEDSRVQEAARQAIDIFSQKNFDRMMREQFGFLDEE